MVSRVSSKRNAGRVKDHWRDKSNIKDIRKCLANLLSVIIEEPIKSIAIPAIGCGLGGLAWSDVKQTLEDYLYIVNIKVTIYEPNLLNEEVEEILKCDICNKRIKNPLYGVSTLGKGKLKQKFYCSKECNEKRNIQ